MRARLRSLTGLVILTLFFSTGIGGGSASAQTVEPGGNSSDTALAIQNPDEYAWKLFLFLNRQALAGQAGIVDPAKNILSYDPDKDVVWETWAVATGGLPVFRSSGEPNTSEVFKDRGEKPMSHYPQHQFLN